MVGDRLGTVIKTDAQYLVSQGVTRHQVAAFLQRAMMHASKSFEDVPVREQKPVTSRDNT